MHEAFRLGAIAEKLPLKIECLETFGTCPRALNGSLEAVPLTAPAVLRWLGACLGTANGSKLLVATAEGVLLMYDVSLGGTSPNNPFQATLVKSNKSFSKKPIEQLTVIEELDILLSLSGPAAADAGGRPRHRAQLTRWAATASVLWPGCAYQMATSASTTYRP